MPRTPSHTIRYGLIMAQIWRKGRTAKAQYVVTVSRLYRNGPEWKQSSRFSPGDLLLASRALDKAHTWIMHQREVTE